MSKQTGSMGKQETADPIKMMGHILDCLVELHQSISTCAIVDLNAKLDLSARSIFHQAVTELSKFEEPVESSNVGLQQLLNSWSKRGRDARREDLTFLLDWAIVLDISCRNDSIEPCPLIDLTKRMSARKVVAYYKKQPKLLTPLTRIASSSRPNKIALQTLVTRCPELCELPNQNHELPIHHACQFSSDADVVDILVDDDVGDLAPSICSLTTQGRNALHYAALNESPLVRSAVFIELFNCITVCVAARQADNSGNLPLHLLVESMRRNDTWDINIMAALVAEYPDGAGKVNSDDILPLHTACRSESVPAEVINILLRAYPEGAAKRDGDGCLPLHYLAMRKGSGSEGIQPLSSVMQRYGDAILRHPTSEVVTGFCRTLLAKEPNPMTTSGTSAAPEEPPEVKDRIFWREFPPMLGSVRGNRDERDGEEVDAEIMRFQHEVDEEDEVDGFVMSSSTLELMQMVHSYYPDAVTINSTNVWGVGVGTPLHCAAGGSDVDAVNFLYTLYPEAAAVLLSGGGLPLHRAARSGSFAVVKAIYKMNPAAICATDVFGELPVHQLMTRDPQGVCWRNPLTEAADILRFLLRQYPESATVESSIDQRSPLSMCKELSDPYFLRLVLRVAPTADISRFHELNYAARRSALLMFVRLAGLSSPSSYSDSAMLVDDVVEWTRQRMLWSKMNHGNTSLLRLIVSYL